MSRLILLALGLLANLIGLPADQSDPSQWGEVALLGAAVWGTVAYLRTHVLKALDGIAVHILAAAVGIGLAVGLGVADVIDGAFVQWVVFGVQATFAATVTDLALKRAGGSGNSLPAA